MHIVLKLKTQNNEQPKQLIQAQVHNEYFLLLVKLLPPSNSAVQFVISVWKYYYLSACLL